MQARGDDLVRWVSTVLTDDQIKTPRGYFTRIFVVLQQACAAPDLALSTDDAERLLRAASGLAHGQDGHERTIRVPDADQMTAILKAACTLPDYSVRGFAGSVHAGIARPIDEAVSWLAQRIPVRGVSDPEIVVQLRERRGGLARRAPESLHEDLVDSDG